MVERTTVRLPSDLIQRARQKAVSEGRTLTSLIEDGLRLVVAGTLRERSRTVRIPVSKATGGLMPGVDLENRSAIQEMEDAEYLERMNRTE